jgi:hypothetical protein
MATIEDGGNEPAFRFKRRKIVHQRRTRLNEDPDESSTSIASPAPTASVPADVQGSPVTPELHVNPEDADEIVPNLKEILRARKRPRDRLREATRKVETTKSVALIPAADAPKPDQYSTRFIAQTGQVVDQDDRQM